MSRPMLYATLAALCAILFGTSVALHKQTDPPKAPDAAAPGSPASAGSPDNGARQKAMRAMMGTQEKEMRIKMMKKMAEEKTKAAAVARTGKPQRTRASGIEITDKWFNESPDGPAGIQQAVKEKEEMEKAAFGQAAAGQPSTGQPASSHAAASQPATGKASTAAPTQAPTAPPH